MVLFFARLYLGPSAKKWGRTREEGSGEVHHEPMFVKC